MLELLKQSLGKLLQTAMRVAKTEFGEIVTSCKLELPTEKVGKLLQGC